MDKLVVIATEAVTKAGEYLHDFEQCDKGIILNKGKDIKLKLDIESQDIIIKHLMKKSKFPIISEENNSTTYEKIRDEKLYWVIDPIDGTYNYSRNIPLYCISVALWSKSIPILGVIYDFYSGYIYQGLTGKYSYVNGKKMTVSNNDKINNAVICSGLPTMRSFSEESLLRFVTIFKKFKKVRFIGSAALSLAWLSSGLVDVYSEEDIYFWDIAAGLAMVKASGGDYYFETNKSSSNLMNVIATNGKIKINDIKKILLYNK